MRTYAASYGALASYMIGEYNLEKYEGDSRKLILKEVFTGLGYECDDLTLCKFVCYYDLIFEKNKVMNLTRITEFKDAAIKHFADSLAVIKILDMRSIRSVIDIGTGAGIPGIPLAIAFPELSITMADSIGKKVSFVNEAITEIFDENAKDISVKCIQARAEELARKPDYREKFDLCVSRAVANMTALCEYCLPFVRTGGCFIAYKSGDCQEEIKEAENAIKMLGGTSTEIKEYDLFGNRRTLIKITKGRQTPDKYPRQSGLPLKKPLGVDKKQIK